MISGTTGLEGAARGRMTTLAAVIALVVGAALTSVFDGKVVIGLILSLLAGAVACAITSGVIVGATRRGGTAALVLITVVVALIVLGITLVFPWFALLPTAGLVWLGMARRRKADRKHGGLRVTR